MAGGDKPTTSAPPAGQKASSASATAPGSHKPDKPAKPGDLSKSTDKSSSGSAEAKKSLASAATTSSSDAKRSVMGLSSDARKTSSVERPNGPSSAVPSSPQRSPRNGKKSPPRGRDAASLDSGNGHSATSGSGDGGDRKPKKSRKMSSVVKGVSSDPDPGGSASAADGAPSPHDADAKEEAALLRVRSLGRRTLTLCQRSDWVAVEQSLKGLERISQDAGVESPLQDVVDEVSPVAPIATAQGCGFIYLWGCPGTFSETSK